MLEIGILVFIVLAVGYWTTLWIMGRRDDVLHGQRFERVFENRTWQVWAVAVESNDASLLTFCEVPKYRSKA